MDEGQQDDHNDVPSDEGPSAPAKQRVMFIPENSSMSRHRWWIQQSIREAKEKRMLSLFGSMDIDDPIDTYIDDPESKWGGRKRKDAEAFKIVPADFLAKARRQPPTDPEPTASGFSSWIYSLYSSAIGKDDDRERGKEVEREVLDRRRAVYQCVDNAYLRRVVSNWALIHNGVEQPENRPIEYRTVDHLRVGGTPLRVSPDLMYQNRSFLKVLIVEIKLTKMFVPTNLWPNVWGQLWCYSQIDVARQADSVCVIGEVWCDDWTRGHRVKGGYQSGECHISLRASVKRNPRLPNYDRFFRELFEIYSGSQVPNIGG